MGKPQIAGWRLLLALCLITAMGAGGIPEETIGDAAPTIEGGVMGVAQKELAAAADEDALISKVEKAITDLDSIKQAQYTNANLDLEALSQKFAEAAATSSKLYVKDRRLRLKIMNFKSKQKFAAANMVDEEIQVGGEVAELGAIEETKEGFSFSKDDDTELAKQGVSKGAVKAVEEAVETQIQEIKPDQLTKVAHRLLKEDLTTDSTVQLLQDEQGYHHRKPHQGKHNDAGKKMHHHGKDNDAGKKIRGEAEMKRNLVHRKSSEKSVWVSTLDTATEAVETVQKHTVNEVHHKAQVQVLHAAHLAASAETVEKHNLHMDETAKWAADTITKNEAHVAETTAAKEVVQKAQLAQNVASETHHKKSLAKAVEAINVAKEKVEKHQALRKVRDANEAKVKAVLVKDEHKLAEYLGEENDVKKQLAEADKKKAAALPGLQADKEATMKQEASKKEIEAEVNGIKKRLRRKVSALQAMEKARAKVTHATAIMEQAKEAAQANQRHMASVEALIANATAIIAPAEAAMSATQKAYEEVVVKYDLDPNKVKELGVLDTQNKDSYPSFAHRLNVAVTKAHQNLRDLKLQSRILTADMKTANLKMIKAEQAFKGDPTSEALKADLKATIGDQNGIKAKEQATHKGYIKTAKYLRETRDDLMEAEVQSGLQHAVKYGKLTQAQAHTAKFAYLQATHYDEAAHGAHASLNAYLHTKTNIEAATKAGQAAVTAAAGNLEAIVAESSKTIALHSKAVEEAQNADQTVKEIKDKIEGKRKALEEGLKTRIRERKNAREKQGKHQPNVESVKGTAKLDELTQKHHGKQWKENFVDMSAADFQKHARGHVDAPRRVQSGATMLAGEKKQKHAQVVAMRASGPQ